MKKSNFLFVLFMTLLILNSCSDESFSDLATEESSPLNKLELEKELAKYPIEITIDNWKEFVYASDEVIEYFSDKEKEQYTKKKEEIKADAPLAKASAGFLFGYVEAFNGGWHPFSGVDVTLGNCGFTTIANSPINYALNSSCGTGPLCMSYDTYWTNGVTTFDLVLIQRHILGITPFTEARQYLAADANRNGVVTTFDLVEIQRLILDIYQELPDSDNILYIPTSDYLNAQAEIDATGFFASLNFYTDTPNCIAPAFLDRRAIKVGDINGTFSF